MKRRKLIKNLTIASGLFFAKGIKASALPFPSISLPLSEGASKALIDGPFEPTWESLKQYQLPEWFNKAKFGIWAHWGPQCQPASGDWNARDMYFEGTPAYKQHVEVYGHPSKFGFKDVINEWKADKWDPEATVALYKKAGAQYFFAMANHHDNFDMFNSQHQPWNAVNMGPKKDIIGGWAKAAKNNGLRFGVSVHAAHAWPWYEPSQLSDTTGSLAGVPYDGNITKAEGKGKWWEGYDPQDLYEQRHHALSKDAEKVGGINDQWNWNHGVSIPDNAYLEKFYNRTVDLIDKYNPDLVYFDDSDLPFWPVSNTGLRIAAHYYNKSKKQKGTTDAIIFGKRLSVEKRQCMVLDIERGQSNIIEPLPWQTDTCIGGWHYNQKIYDEHRYKTAATVIQILVDVVSKNGNLLLNIPLKGDGTMDEQERAVIDEITAWMDINKTSIFDTKPWKIPGEGPEVEANKGTPAKDFSEKKPKHYTAEDMRFAINGSALYVTVFAPPANGKITVKSLDVNNSLYPSKINKITLLGHTDNLVYERNTTGLTITLPKVPLKHPYGYVFKIV